MGYGNHLRISLSPAAKSTDPEKTGVINTKETVRAWREKAAGMK